VFFCFIFEKIGKNMKHLVKLFYLVIFCAITAGCKKSTVTDVYYVKYQVESSTIYYGGKLNVQISNENGSLPLVINQRENWETTIGPVSKGFIASLKVTKQGWDGVSAENHLKLYLRIQVSKNNEPFALKQNNGSDSPRAIAETKYVIE
jgi:hypothetical protein